MKKLVIIARLNEYASRQDNPNIPFSPAEIAEDAAACRAVGAAGVHFHARASGDGTPVHDTMTYAEIARRIREKSDVLVEPPLAYMGFEPAEDRPLQVVELARDPQTRADVASVDMASVNMGLYDAERKTLSGARAVFENPNELLVSFTKQIRAAGMKTLHVCWNVPSVRMVQAFAEMDLIASPIWVALRLTECGVLAGHPATVAGIEAYRRFFPADRPIEWMAVASPGSLLPVAEYVIREGGHISAGLGDYPYRELGCPTNADVVRWFADLARSLGREVATPDEAREILGVRDVSRAELSAATG